MSTFRYKDKRLKYSYMLVLALLFVLRSVTFPLELKGGFTAAAFVFLLAVNIPFLVVLFIAIAGLRETVLIGEDEVVFYRFGRRRISYGEIQEIRLSDNVDLGCEIVNQGNTAFSWSLCFFESDEDIGAFQQAVKEIITRAKLANPKIHVDKRLPQLVDETGELSQSVAQRKNARRAALRGIDGWLLYLAFSLGMSALAPLVDSGRRLAQSAGSLAASLQPVLSSAIALNIVLALAAAALFVLLLRKKQSFCRYYLLYQPVEMLLSVSVTMLYRLLDGKPLLSFSPIYGAVLSAVAAAGWYFAWREYFRRSIRVKNTLVR